MVSQRLPFIFPWILLMVFYLIWEFITLYYFKSTSPFSEGEIIEMRLYSLRNLFKKIIIPFGIFGILLLLIILPDYSIRIIFVSTIILAVIIFILLRIKVNSRSSTGKDILIIILSIIPFLLFFPMSPYMVIFIAGMIAFIKSIVFSLTMSHISSYSLKARYIAMQIMVIILMVVTFNLAVNYIPGG